MRRLDMFLVQYNKAFVYISNNFDLTAVQIAAIYGKRWQIETFFKIKTKFFAHLLLWS